MDTAISARVATRLFGIGLLMADVGINRKTVLHHPLASVPVTVHYLGRKTR
jgi:hypothetical protein